MTEEVLDVVLKILGIAIPCLIAFILGMFTTIMIELIVDKKVDKEE